MTAFAKNRLRPVRAAGEALLVVGLALLAPARVELPSTPPPPPGNAAALHPAHRWTPGEQSLWRLDFHSVASFDFAPVIQGLADSSGPGAVSAAGAMPRGVLAARVQGLLSTTVLDHTAAGSLIASRAFVHARIARDGQEAAGPEADVAADLSRLVLFQVDPAGRVLSVRFDPAAGSLPQGIARALIAAQQVVLPEPVRQRWEAQEDDPNGLALAVYEITGPGAFHKRKARFLSGGPGAEGTPAIVPGGSLRGRFDMGDGHLLSLEGTETQDVHLMGKRVAHSESTLSLRLERRETLSSGDLAELKAAAASRAAQVEAVALSDSGPRGEAEEALQRNELGSATVDSLLSRLAHLDEGGQREDETGLYLDLKALAFLQPESCRRIGATLATARADGPTMRLLAMVLAGAGHLEAQEALARAVRSRRHDPEALTVLVPALGDIQDPAPATEDVLWDVALGAGDPDIASMAQLALGTMASHLSATSPDRALHIVDWAADRVRSSPSPRDRRSALLVLGNAASARALPVVVRSLDDPASEVRAGAVVALQGLQEPGVPDLLARILGEDEDAWVRLQASVALGSRPLTPQSVRAQEKAFAREADVAVRLVILRNLAAARPTFPDVDELLRRTVADDPSPDVRQAAAKLLNDGR